MNELEQAISEIEKRTGVRPGFFEELIHEDDWSFIIKSHALIESACAQILSEKTGVKETIDIFSRLELGARNTGKLAFLKAYGLLIEKERRFISALSELRNTLVHNVSHTSFVLHDYVNSLDKNQRAKFVEDFGYAYLSEISNEAERAKCREKILAEPKKSMWLGIKYILGLISLQIDQIRLQQEIIEMKSRTKILPSEKI